MATAPHGRPEFFELLKDTEYYIGAGQFKHGPEFYQAAPKLRIVQTLSAGYNTYDLEAARSAGVPISFHWRPPPRRFIPLPFEIRRAFDFALGALSTMG